MALEGWIEGFLGGWMDGKAGLRIADSNKKPRNSPKDLLNVLFLIPFTTLLKVIPTWGGHPLDIPMMQVRLQNYYYAHVTNYTYSFEI